MLKWSFDLFSLKPKSLIFIEDDNHSDFGDYEELCLEQIPPGFTRGLPFADLQKGSSSPITVPKFSLLHHHHQSPLNDTATHDKVQASTEVVLDELVGKQSETFTFISNQSRSKASAASKKLSYARPVDLDRLPEDFDLVVPELAHDFPFPLDTFQLQAVYHLERGDSLFVAAHTSAGKTVVAEYALALSQKHMTKTIYTSPIKALSNQKFRDFKEIFDSVGLLTGDIQLNPDASCLIMTTEILRSMLYRGASLISDIEFVIFDEVHYVNDQDRGVVWEEVIIMLPPHVTVIMLSATTPNNLEFAEWVGRTRNRQIHVISTLKRPVPLEHFLFTNRITGKSGKELYKIVDGGRVFNEMAYRSALQSLQSNKERELAAAKNNNAVSLNKGSNVTNLNAFRSTNQDRNLWTDVVYYLQKHNLLPVVAFTFSKRKCDENADSLATSLDLNSASEKSTVHVFFQSCLEKLSGTDRELPQIVWLQGLLSRGIAVHHSGLLPLLKEAVEILFSRGLVKVLFATETFAMGVNMPARTVVFSSLRKHDGNGFRYLHPGEYTQMAGRAGRRGKDATGTVIILSPEAVLTDAILRQIILGTPTKLVSQFRLTYQMILSLLRIESLRVEEMLKRSFSEDGNQKAAPEQAEALANEQKLLAGLQELRCPICLVDLEDYYAACRDIRDKMRSICFEGFSRRLFNRIVEMGTIVLVDLPNGPSSIPAIFLKRNSDNSTSFTVAVPSEITNVESNSAYFYPPWHVNRLPLKTLSRSLSIHVITLESSSIVKIYPNKLKISADSLTPGGQINAKDVPGFVAEYASLCALESKTIDWQSEAKFPQFSSSAGGFEIDEIIIIRRHCLAALPSFTCHSCPELFAHYDQMHRKRLLTDRLATLQFQLSEQNLHLLPEYKCRVRLLTELDYLDSAHTVQLKGRVACEINTVDPLILTELLFENAFGHLSPAECAAFLAALVFQERSSLSSTGIPDSEEGRESIEGLLSRLLIEKDEDESSAESGEEVRDEVANIRHRDYLINVTEGIEKTVRRLVTLAADLSAKQRDSGLGHLICGSSRAFLQSIFNPALIRTVYLWCQGTSFLTLTTEITTIPEGSIVRCVTRLDETLREAAGAGKIMGDPNLVAKMEEAAQLIRRDICFASSLYI